jgi:PPOX class probable F420-dependent enzyme
MRLEPAEARQRFAASPVLRLATADADGRPHVVPCTFVVDETGRVAIGIDNKPKSSPAGLRRLRNIAANPQVSMIVDHYADDWSELWWSRADGIAAIEEAGSGPSGAEHASHWDLLRAKYPQYAGQLLDGPVIVVAVESWTGWTFRDHSRSLFPRER